LLDSLAMIRSIVAACALGVAIPSLGLAQSPPPVDELLCGRVNVVDAGGGMLVVTTDDERLLTVRVPQAGDQLAVLQPGEDVVMVASPGLGGHEYRAQAIYREWSRGRGPDAWRCLRGHVLSASPETVVVRTPGGEIVATDRRAAAQDVRDVFRGERVAIVGRVIGTDPTTLAATRIRLLPR
jgi:hypothetical protein